MKRTITVQRKVGGNPDTFHVLGVNGWRVVTSSGVILLVPVPPSDDSPMTLPNRIPDFETARICAINPLGWRNLAEAERIGRLEVRNRRQRGAEPAEVHVESVADAERERRHCLLCADDLALVSVWNHEALDSGMVKYKAEFTLHGEATTTWLSALSEDVGLTPEDARIIEASRRPPKTFHSEGGKATSKFYGHEREAARLKRVMSQARRNFIRDHGTKRGANGWAYTQGRAWWQREYKRTELENYLDQNKVSDSCLWRILHKDLRGVRKARA